MAVIKQIKDSNGDIHDIIDTNTLNTTGATQTTDKVYVVGAKEQSANPVTYTNQQCYIGTDNCLYSNGVKVATISDITDSDTKNTSGASQLSATKLYMVGAQEQSTNPVTYTNQQCYIGTDNCLYSNGSKVSTSDTKNTAGATQMTGKVYIVGAKGQGTSALTYTNIQCYIGTDNCLYSNGVKVATLADISDTKNTAGATSVPTDDGKASFYLVGTKTSGESSAQTYVNNSVYVDVINGNILYVPNIRTSGNIICDGVINASNFQTTGGVSCNFLTSGEVVADRILNTTKIVDEATNTDIITLGKENDMGEWVGDIEAHGITLNGGGMIISNADDQIIVLNGGNITTNNGIITASAFYESSDERLKTFTEEYDINLDNLKNIKTGKFYWNADNTQEINGGVSAQTVEQYFPELVRENDEGFKTVNYDGLAVVAIAAIKKLTERIEELENIVYNK